MKIKINIALVLFLTILQSCNQTSKQYSSNTFADAIYYGGDIITMEGDSVQYAEAVAVKSGKILFVGIKTEAEKMQGESTVMHDLKGKTLLPGFIDAHGHVSLVGLQAASANLLPPPDGNGSSIDSLVAIGKRWYEQNKATAERIGWIVCFGYDDAQLKEQRHPTANDLDRVSTTLPVLYIHQSAHLMAVNHKGLEVCGINASKSDPEGGVIRREKDGKTPNGVLEENAVYGPVIKLYGNLKDNVRDKMMAAGLKMYVSFGYTTAQEGKSDASTWKTLVTAAENNKLEIDVPVNIMDNNQALLSSPYLSKTYKNHLRIAGTKITLDGSPQGKTAWLTKPYKIPPPGATKDYRGYPALKDQQVNDMVDSAFKNNWQLNMHCNGDAAIDQMINAVALATSKYGKADRRPVMVHAQVIRMDQLDSLKKYGIIPSFFGMHTFYWGDWHRDETLGKERAYFISPAATALKKGIIFTQHHDAPVAFPSAITILHTVVNRVSRSGDIIGSDERISPYVALESITKWAAYQYFEENSKGTITKGKLADFVILDKNPVKIDPMKIIDLKVMETVKEGNTIYQNNSNK